MLDQRTCVTFLSKYTVITKIMQEAGGLFGKVSEMIPNERKAASPNLWLVERWR